MVANSFQLAGTPFFMYSEKREPLEQDKKEIMFVSSALLPLWTLPQLVCGAPSFPQLCKQRRCGNCKDII